MNLKEYLSTKGVKQKWLARQIGVSEVTMSCWCNGKAKPHQRHLDRILKVLDLSPDKISELL
jgi:DNA-binding Xre family transcriptional regulator